MNKLLSDVEQIVNSNLSALDLTMVKCAFKNSAFTDHVVRIETITELAVEYGSILWLKRCEQKTRTSGLCKLASKYGQIKILKYARRHGYFWDRNTSSEAAYAATSKL